MTCCFLRYKISGTALRVALRDKPVMSIAFSRFLLMAAYSVLQNASLISPALHSRASLRKLRSTSFHSISAPFVSAICSPPAAQFVLACWSPPASGLSCLLQKKSKSHASPLLQAVAIQHPFQVFPVCHRWLHSQSARA